MTADIIISADALQKIYRDFWHRPRVKAVNGISFNVRKGELFGLLGPNGSGKSTTIKMILGLLHPTGGSLTVLNASPRDVKTKARIGYLPEETYLYPYLTARETLFFFGHLFRIPHDILRRRVDELLEMIGLEQASGRLVGEFSKGMARRIGLAQALLNDPDLIILDEPTSGLDPIGCRQVKDILLALTARGKTILLSSHLLADVEDVCSRIAILYNGSIQATGKVSELLEVRDRTRLTLPATATGDQTREIIEKTRTLLSAEPDVDHPRMDLESYFLKVVNEARDLSREDSGVGREKGVAPFLKS